MKTSRRSTSEIRMERQKSEFVEQLKLYPNIQVACEKLHVKRSTFYRWRSEDFTFRNRVEKAVYEGAELIDDLVDNKFISLMIHDKKWASIKYYLETKHPLYRKKNNKDLRKMSVLDLVAMADDPDSDEDEDEDD